MLYQTLQIEQQGKLATIWLNRPERHNAISPVMIEELTAAVGLLNADNTVRVLILAGRGPSFCSGADLEWMKQAADYTEAQNLADAQNLATLLKTLYRSPKPIIARIHGAALAGGTGLTAVCDIAVATDAARFGLTEVRLGLIPATIGPYVAEAIGQRQARRYFLSAETITARMASHLGLVHEVVPEAELDQRIQTIAHALLQGAPGAQAASKHLLAAIQQGNPWDDTLLDDTARRIAATRVATEAREGLTAFFDKRRPSWQEE